MHFRPKNGAFDLRFYHPSFINLFVVGYATLTTPTAVEEPVPRDDPNEPHSSAAAAVASAVPLGGGQLAVTKKKGGKKRKNVAQQLADQPPRDVSDAAADEFDGGPSAAKKSTKSSEKVWRCVHCVGQKLFERSNKLTHHKLMDIFERHFKTVHANIGIGIYIFNTNHILRSKT